jgi:hypothetical protein
MGDNPVSPSREEGFVVKECLLLLCNPHPALILLDRRSTFSSGVS